MPKKSERQTLISLLSEHRTLKNISALVQESSSSEDEFDDTDLEYLFDSDSSSDDDPGLTIELSLTASRYLGERPRLPKRKGFYKFVCQLDDNRYRSVTRMTRTAFRKVCDLIRNDAVFCVPPINPKAHKPQAPVEEQLMVALFRFGHEGNAASIVKVALQFGISEGSVMAYTDRVLEALLHQERAVVKWPSGGERKTVKDEIKAKSGFPNCLGFVDGTLLNLAYKPAINGEDYFSRKRTYAIAAMIVCDLARRIRFCIAGFTGSAHDTRVYRSSSIAIAPEKYFSSLEYLLADSGYPCNAHIIPSYKKNSAGCKQENADFNYAVASVRVNVENCIGILKGRFQSLRGLRFQLRNAKENKKAVLWFRACCVLHNLLLEDPYDSEWDQSDDSEDESGGDEELQQGVERVPLPNRREQLKLLVRENRAEMNL